MPEPLTAIIVGAGHRGLTYASYAEEHPGELKIVGVADLIERRRKSTATRFGFSQEMCFETAEELVSRGKLADCVINGTMDHQHVPTCLPLLDAGYDILLEKPFATGEEEMWALVESARRNNRKVMICHVLRYAPFYYTIRERVAAGVEVVLAARLPALDAHRHVLDGAGHSRLQRRLLQLHDLILRLLGDVAEDSSPRFEAMMRLDVPEDLPGRSLEIRVQEAPYMGREGRRISLAHPATEIGIVDRLVLPLCPREVRREFGAPRD